MLQGWNSLWKCKIINLIVVHGCPHSYVKCAMCNVQSSQCVQNMRQQTRDAFRIIFMLNIISNERNRTIKVSFPFHMLQNLWNCLAQKEEAQKMINGCMQKCGLMYSWGCQRSEGDCCWHFPWKSNIFVNKIP